MPKLPPWVQSAWIAGLAIVGTSCSLVHHVYDTVEDKIEHIKDEAVALPPPKLPLHPSMHALAHDLDCIEQQIDWYGSVVAKAPDVWSEARLTRHREEFEKEMKGDLSLFEAKINGIETRADLAFVSQAYALSVAARGGSINVTSPTTAEGMIKPPDGKAREISETEKAALALEPTIHLEQKNRYLNFLNQLRRNNEGDDTADSPGYSLNLVRIPVSILPGKRTQQGHGAEITFTIEPILSDELLPMTTRTLMAADLVDSFGMQLLRLLEDREFWDHFSNYLQVQSLVPASELPSTQATATMNPAAYAKQKRQEVIQSSKNVITKNSPNAPRSIQAGSFNAGHNLHDLAGEDYAFKIIEQATKAIGQADYPDKSYIHLPDIQGYLKTHIAEAYKLLTSDAGQPLWQTYCNRELAQALRNKDEIETNNFRTRFMAALDRKPTLLARAPDTQAGFASSTLTAAFAWCLIANGALFTENLLEEIKQTSIARNQPLDVPSWSDIASPMPSSASRTLFNNYVRIRWPIRVFALDPMTQDQNISDESQSRRETQLALSVAFVSGRMSASRFIREARTLEVRGATIALNRTQIGFSHGENTFGWRFYPRYQVPRLGGGVAGLAHDELLGGLNESERLKQRYLEPGPRECVAIVMMPSFVPYLTCDSFSNWFSLNNPKMKVFDQSQALNLGKHIKILETHGPGVSDAEHYRDGDFQRLLRRVKQLDARLPSQTVSIPVPVRDNLNASDLFTTGTAALAPELHAFYGAPGIDLAKEYVTLFLVGDHFRTGQTWVGIGNTRGEKNTQPALPNFRLLSKQVLQIRMKTNEMMPDENGNAHIHIATPYGVTQGLKIPVYRSAPPAAPATIPPAKKEPPKKKKKDNDEEDEE